MSSEWMRVMLDEIARKKSEAGEAAAESERRNREQAATPAPEVIPGASGVRPTE